MKPPFFTALSPGAVSLNPPDFPQACALARAGGFDGIEVPVASIEGPGGIEATLEALQGHGLRPAGWGIPFDWRVDEATWRAGLNRLPAWAETASKLGADRAVTWVLSFSDQREYAENFAFHRERLAPIASILAAHGCRFGLEYLGPRTLRKGHPHEFAHTLPAMLDLCRAVGPHVGLLLDAWHWFTAGENVGTLSGLSASDIVYVHVNDAPAGISVDEQIDNRRCLPGATGVIPIGAFLQTLATIGYDGPVVPEPFDASLKAMADDHARVTAAGESMRSIWKTAGW